MDLQALYDVKDRLEHSAIAGTKLLADDFRLKKAAEGLQPLAAASPVFAKLQDAVTALFTAPAEEQNALLLDALSLIDAVAYTQGGCGVEGELEPLPAGSGSYVQASYGDLAPLVEALTTTGGGRQEVIETAYREHPDYFRDYRIRPLLIGALGDGYSAIADIAENILGEQCDASLIPLLKERLDLAGKKSAAVHIISLVASLGGGEENGWLVSLLPAAKGEVRRSLIDTLGRFPGANGPLLLDLAKTERGETRDAVLRQLLNAGNGELASSCAALWEERLDKMESKWELSAALRDISARDTPVAKLLKKRIKKDLRGNLSWRGGRKA